MHVLPPNPQTPFDMEEFLHMSSSYDMDKVMRTYGVFTIRILSILSDKFLGSFRGMHDCLVPLTAWLGTIFESVRKESKIPVQVRAVDMRNILLVLPFLLHNLLEEEVEEYNRIKDRRRAEEALVCIRLSAGGILRPLASR